MMMIGLKVTDYTLRMLLRDCSVGKLENAGTKTSSKDLKALISVFAIVTLVLSFGLVYFSHPMKKAL